MSNGCSYGRRSTDTAATSARPPRHSDSHAARCIAASPRMGSEMERTQETRVELDARDSAPESGSASYERRIFQLALLGGLPALAVAFGLLIHGHYSAKVQWTLGLLMVVTWLLVAALVRERVVRPLQTLSNLLGALREGDYSIRARGADRDDALGLAFLEANILGETLRSQRLGAMEASTLLRTVMAEIDVAVYAFDEQ